jgi:catechol 2,3-dioxygenase-like lactoylglutathione lyase family enzyme
MMPVLRIARPTCDFEPLRRFYGDGLGFQLLASFDDHTGFDGWILGHPQAAYHLEFTRHPAVQAVRAPTHEHQLVFYMPEHAQWQAAVARMQAAGCAEVEPFNPWWARGGASFEDADGYRVVLFNGEWTL